MNQLLYAEKNYHGLSINCKLRTVHLLTESTINAALSQSTILFSAQIQFTISHVSFPQSILPINQPVDQGIRYATEHATKHATENSIEYAIIQPNEHQSKRHRFFIQSARRLSRIFSENEKFEKTPEPQFLKYQSNSRNDVKYQSNSRNDVKYQPDLRNNKYQPNLRNEVRSNRDRNEIENEKYNSKSQNVKKQQKFYYENIYQQQSSFHSAVESVHSMHQSMHSFSFKIFVRSHIFQIQLIRRPIPQRSHTIINQSIFTFQNFSFHRATDQPSILPQISQSKYVSISAVSFASAYIPAYASDNASVNAFTNAPVYTLAYAFTYATVYAPAAVYASESAAASTRASKFEMAVFD